MDCSDESELDDFGSTSDDAFNDPTSRIRRSLECLLDRSCALMLVFGTIVGGALVLKVAENWSFTTAIYVIVQIVTTIGYGDITVSTDGMRLFMALYVLWCLVMVAYFLNAFLQAVLERQTENLRHHMRKVERKQIGGTELEVRHVMSAWNQAFAASLLFAVFLLVGTVFYGWIHRGCPVDDAGHATDCVNDKDGMPTNTIQSFYMSVITMTTVGFGDYRPRTTVGRIFGIFWMVGGVATTAFFVSAVQNLFFSVEEDRRIQSITVHEELDRQTFEEMDTDNNGYLTRSEFRSYVLLKHGVITSKDLDAIDEKFNMLAETATTRDYSGLKRVTYQDVMKFQQRLTEKRLHG